LPKSGAVAAANQTHLSPQFYILETTILSQALASDLAGSKSGFARGLAIDLQSVQSVLH